MKKLFVGERSEWCQLAPVGLSGATRGRRSLFQSRGIGALVSRISDREVCAPARSRIEV